MDQQETKPFAKSVDLPAISVAGATPFSYHAGFFRLLDSIQIWSYLARKSLKIQNWTRKSKNIRN